MRSKAHLRKDCCTDQEAENTINQGSSWKVSGRTVTLSKVGVKTRMAHTTKANGLGADLTVGASNKFQKTRSTMECFYLVDLGAQGKKSTNLQVWSKRVSGTKANL
jgi:hypothetical protein